MKKKLILEKDKGGNYWGRLMHDNNLIIEFGKTIEQIEINMRKLLNQFHGLHPNKILFIIKYDVS